MQSGTRRPAVLHLHDQALRNITGREDKISLRTYNCTATGQSFRPQKEGIPRTNSMKPAPIGMAYQFICFINAGWRAWVISEWLYGYPFLFFATYAFVLRPAHPAAILANIPTESSVDERNIMDTETSEESPLLLNSNTHSRESNEPSGVRRLSYSPGGLITITLVIALIASAEAGSILQLVPLNQVLEKIICENAHQPASTCGENADVQAELALLRGWQSTFDLLPGQLCPASF